MQNKNKINKNKIKIVETNTDIKSSISNKNLMLVNNLNNLKSNVTQDFYNNINSLKNKIIDLNSVSLNKETIKNYIKNNKLINLETKQNLNLELSQSSKLNDSILTFSSLLKGLDQNLSKFDLNVLKIKTSNIYENKLNNNDLSRVSSQINVLPNPKMESRGLFMSLSTTNDFYFYLINALNFFNESKNKKLLTTNHNLNLAKKSNINNNLTPKIRHYLNLLTKYNYNLSTNYFDFIQFKKSNKYLFKMERATELLKLAFFSKGCLISKPIFNITYPYDSNINEINEISFNKTKKNNKNICKPKIIIHLFFYVKTKGFLNNNLFTAIQTSNLNDKLNFNISNIYTEENKYLNLKNLSAKITPIISDINDNKYITTIFNDKFIYLCDYLSKLFNAEIELELIRLYQPYQDSNILVQYLNSQSYNKRFRTLMYKLFKKVQIYKRKKFFNLPSLQEIINNKNLNPVLFNEPVSFPSVISGINIKLAGRPMKESIIPRFTVQRAQKGNFDRLNAKIIEKSMFTDQTKKGSFSFTVRLSHIFK